MLSLSNKFQSLSGFEKIKTIGRGAYGTAVLYRKKDDNSVVVLKEINLLELNAASRQLAQNEILVLSMLDHPNIIGYYDSFEENGILILEMEYAEGGTLSKYLSQQGKPLLERIILEKFRQMASAIKYIHQHNILHRDLKTENIFLMHDEVVKIGDFGISKLMPLEHSSTTATVVGTPYYISPEMCEGKAYNNKSDIWALGCVLYEMTCFQKTFDGSNLPALVNKIMRGQFAPIKGEYSDSLKSLLMDMLQRDPELRPSAAHIHNDILPGVMDTHEKQDKSECDIQVGSKKMFGATKTRTLLYSYDLNNSSWCPIVMPPKKLVSQLASSSDHAIVLTSDWLVFSWGQNGEGQLGHGDMVSRNSPTLVETLKDKSVTKIACGKDFTAFLSGNGLIMTCGNGFYGCLGHGEWSSLSVPKLVEALLSEDVKEVACGPKHVIAVTPSGRVFGWGSGECGALGLNEEINQCKPQEILLPSGHKMVDCFCGSSCTILLSNEGQLFASGDNRHDKLGLNYRQGFLAAVKNLFDKSDSRAIKQFSLIKSLARHKVSKVSMGANHTCALLESGQVFMAGLNTGGQLGVGDLRRRMGFVEVPCLIATSVACSNNFTVATTKSELLIWGCYRQSQLADLLLDWKSDSRVSSAHSCSVSSEDGRSPENYNSSDYVLTPLSLLPAQLVSLPPSNESNEVNTPGSSHSSLSVNFDQIFTITNCLCQHSSLLLSIETVIPDVPKKNSESSKQKSPHIFKSDDLLGDSLCDSQPPSWLKKELDEAGEDKIKGYGVKRVKISKHLSSLPKSAGRFKQKVDIRNRVMLQQKNKIWWILRFKKCWWLHLNN